MSRSRSQLPTVLVWMMLVWCSHSGAHPVETSEVESRGPVAVVDGHPIDGAEIGELVKGRIARLESDLYDVKRRALNTIIERRLIESEARRRSMSVDELLLVEVDSQVSQPAEAEVAAVYDVMRNRYANVDRNVALKEIKSSLAKQRSVLRRSKFVADLRAQSRISVLMEPPRLDKALREEYESTEGRPFKGATRPTVTIVQFSDFECPYCAKSVATLESLLKKYPNELRLVHHDYILESHKNAAAAAEAARCAHEQGKFWEFYGAALSSQGQLGHADLRRHANAAGMQRDRFETCVASGKYSQIMAESNRNAERSGVSGTPTFFVNGRLINGAQSVEVLSEVIDDELARHVYRGASATK